MVFQIKHSASYASTERHHYSYPKSHTEHMKLKRLLISHPWEGNYCPATRSKCCKMDNFWYQHPLSVWSQIKHSLSFFCSPRRKHDQHFCNFIELDIYSVFKGQDVKDAVSAELNAFGFNRWMWRLSSKSLHNKFNLRQLFLKHVLHQLLTPMKSPYSQHDIHFEERTQQQRETKSKKEEAKNTLCWW